jgi:NH3-dependent NAD+ synthetase
LSKVLLGLSGGMSSAATGNLYFDDFGSVRVSLVSMINLFLPSVTH